MTAGALRRFGLVDPSRHAEGPAAHAIGMADFDKNLLLETVRALAVDKAVLNGVAVAYMRSMRTESAAVAESLVTFIESTPSFEAQMFAATSDALVFANLAGALYPEAFRCSLTALRPLQWEALDKMRRHIFMMSVDLLFESGRPGLDLRARRPVARTNAEAFMRATAPKEQHCAA